MAREALDSRLWEFSVPAEVARQVEREHRESATACPACGYRPTKKQQACPSREIATALLRGRKPHWHGDTAPANQGKAQQAEQTGLFEVPETTRRT